MRNQPTYSSTYRLYFVVALLALGACAQNAPPPAAAAAAGGPIRSRNEGYSILHKLMDDESGVSKLLIIKHADEPLAGLVKQIAAACNSAKEEMDKWAASDKLIEFNVPDLPPAETAVRKQTADADTKALLFNSGKNFELRLAFTQIQAMNYGAELCRAIEPNEDDPGRKQFLTNLAKQCDGFSDQLMNLLAEK